MKLICVLLVVGLIACQERTKITGQKNKHDITGADIPLAEQSCYVYIKGKDTAHLTIITTGFVSTGELHYTWFEKDQSKGSLAGELHGDTLIADYTFNAEGKQSVRQVVFLKKGSKFLEGFGEVEEKNGKTQFKDLKQIEFGNSVVFEPTVCR